MWRIWIAALLWGANWPAVKIILGHAGPWSLRAAGLACGTLVLAIIARVSGERLNVPRGHIGRVIVAGLLNVAGFNICAVFAQLSMPTSRAAIMTFTMPLWAAVFSRIALGEPIDLMRGVSLALGAAGLCILALPFIDIVRDGGVPFGLIYVLGAAIFWAAGTVYLRARPVNATPIASTFWQVAVGALVCAIGLALFETPRLDLSQPSALAAFVYHVIFPQAVAYALWFTLARRVSATTVSLGTLLIPVFAVAITGVLLSDWPSPLDVAGLALIMLAVTVDQVMRRTVNQGND
jgi:drug/metabolite transporter (DMT)-like permease